MLFEIICSFVVVEVIGFWYGYQVWKEGRKRFARDIVRALVGAPVVYVMLVLMIGLAPMPR